MGLEQRLQKLEDELGLEDSGPGLEQRLRDALAEARERRTLGIPRPPLAWCDDDAPLAQRLRRALARAEEARRQLGAREAH